MSDRALKLLALDVDGTLLDDEHRLSPLTRDIIREWAANGVMVALCTGRGPLNTLPVMEELEIEGYLLTHNGAVTCHSSPFRIIREQTFDVRKVAELIRYCRTEAVHFDLCTATELFCEQMRADVARMYEHFLIRPQPIVDALDWHQSLVKLTLYGEPEQMDKAQRDCACLLPSGLQMTRSDLRFIDFMLTGINKGSALAELCRLYRIAPAEVMAIGNYYNDQQMIEFAGTGVAMGNAPADLQAIADQVAPSNNEDGVYHILKEWKSSR